MEMDILEKQPAVILTPSLLLEQWQGHRRVTRRVIEAFPEHELFNYSVGGMRTASELAMEIISMCAPGIRGLATGKWQTMEDFLGTTMTPKTKAELLTLWDRATEAIDEFFPQITAQRFQETDAAFGQYKGKVYWLLFYFIDNEIHHRGQAYVYRRSLGIEPPPFWARD